MNDEIEALVQEWIDATAMGIVRLLNDGLDAVPVEKLAAARERALEHMNRAS